MPMAIIIKVIGDQPVYSKLDPTPEEKNNALKLHEELKDLIPKLEAGFGKKVSNGAGDDKKRKSRIDNKLIYKLGEKLKQVVLDKYKVSDEDIDLVFTAISNNYTSKKVFLHRGKRRDDLRYIFEAAKIPYQFFDRITWDGWRRLMDSPSIRSEKRFFSWLESKYLKAEQIKRGFIRQFIKELNTLLKNKDTSIFSEAELFEIYEKAWNLTQQSNYDQQEQDKSDET